MYDGGKEEHGRGEPAVRRHLTSYTSIINKQQQQLTVRTIRDRRLLQPHFQYMRDVTTPSFNRYNPADGVCSHFLLHGFNKLGKAPVHAGCWSSDGRRLVLGTQQGEFTLWEDDTFKFEKLVTAHLNPIRAMAWSINAQMLLSGDHEGIIKYFNASMTNVRNIPDAHAGAVRGLTFSPSESKYASCSDDSSVKIWDWERGVADVSYVDQHLSDVKCCEWHPARALVASGSKDNTVKLWDPREAQSVSTIHGHKNTVLCCSWNSSGNWLATGSRDHLVKVFDIRTMKECAILRGHQKEVSSVKWHPTQEALLLSGGFNGTLIYWVMGYQGPHSIIANAHNYSVNVLAWHPLGHCVASAANDGILKFWSREPPGSQNKVEIRNEWQDPSMALKITYGPLEESMSIKAQQQQQQLLVDGGGERGERRERREGGGDREDRHGPREGGHNAQHRGNRDGGVRPMPPHSQPMIRRDSSSAGSDDGRSGRRGGAELLTPRGASGGSSSGGGGGSYYGRSAPAVAPTMAPTMTSPYMPPPPPALVGARPPPPFHAPNHTAPYGDNSGGPRKRSRFSS